MASRVDKLVEEVIRQVAAGVYRSGQRLPSVRQGASLHGVSKNTMAEAYDRLVVRGVVAARAGSGFYATGEWPTAPVPTTPHVAEAIGIVSLLREQLEQHYEVRAGDGRPPASWMEGSEIRRFMRSSRSSEVEYGYGSPWGLAGLRHWLRMSLAERQIPVAEDGIALTHGINHGQDLIIRHLLEPGDTVFVDSPGYYPLFGKLRLANIVVVPIRRGPDGPDLADLAEKLERHRPEIYFTQSQAHNPTGSGLSPAQAFSILQMAELHDFRIVEDDVFADILPPTLPRLAAFGKPERVIYLGSFSKTLSAGLRCGYVAAAPDIVRRIVDIKMLTTVSTSAHVEQLVLDLIEGGHYLRHLRRLRTRIDEAMKESVAALASVGLKVTPPSIPGFYLWVPLPEGTDEEAMVRRAAARDIFIAPSSVFHPDRAEMSSGMRINVAYGADPRLIEFLKEELG
ncbi:PLP-dependent aminotransferase family protein [Cereibacter sp. SYSU M97828]|nr:PLP-dependent aminotransferase family protein [Cereibacter flavus]